MSKPEGMWTVIRIPEGTAACTQPCEFGAVLFGRHITPADLKRVLGSPDES